MGPILPATRRGRPVSRVNWSATSRARAAPAWLISRTRSESPYSRRARRLARKVLVSMTSQPTARYEAWISRITSGLVRTR